MENLFYLCINNQDCPDLVSKKVYQSINDSTASNYGQIRIIDESEEDYLYPEGFFVPVEIPKVAEFVFDLVA